MQPAKPGSDRDYAARKHNKVGLRSLMLNTITLRFDSLIIMTIIMISATPKFNLHTDCMGLGRKTGPAVSFVLFFASGLKN